MNQINISIKCSGAAFDEAEHLEVARILKELAARIEDGHEPKKLMDINGNVVGKVEYD